MTAIPAELSESLRHLALELRRALTPPKRGDAAPPRRPTGQGEGDVSFAPDDLAEGIIDDWFEARARRGPISLLTEDRGWRHAVPGQGPGGWKRAADFAHGGPRIAIDPVDGTRPFLHGLRSAWTVIAAAPAGDREPWLRDIEWSCVSEIPCGADEPATRLEATKGGGCHRFDDPPALSTERDGDPAHPIPRPWNTEDRAAVDYAFFSFFAYHPSIRPAVDRLAWQFFERLQRFEGAEVDHCYDDQYIASGGQLALLALGRYAMVCDPRPRVPSPMGSITQCAKPYDLAGAVLCAREAGCQVFDLDGKELDVPLDTNSPVGWLGFPGPRSGARLLPHWLAIAAERNQP